MALNVGAYNPLLGKSITESQLSAAASTKVRGGVGLDSVGTTQNFWNTSKVKKRKRIFLKV